MFALFLFVAVAFAADNIPNADIGYDLKNYYQETTNDGVVIYILRECSIKGTTSKKYTGYAEEYLKLEEFENAKCEGKAKTTTYPKIDKTKGKYVDAIPEYVAFEQVAVDDQCKTLVDGKITIIQKGCVASPNGKYMKSVLSNNKVETTFYTDNKCESVDSAAQKTTTDCGRCGKDEGDQDTNKFICGTYPSAETGYDAKKYYQEKDDYLYEVYFLNNCSINGTKSHRYTGHSSTHLKVEDFENTKCEGTAKNTTYKQINYAKGGQYLDAIPAHIAYQQPATTDKCDTFIKGKITIMLGGCQPFDGRYVKFDVTNNKFSAKEYQDAQCKTGEQDGNFAYKCGECSGQSQYDITSYHKFICVEYGKPIPADPQPVNPPGGNTNKNGTTASFIMIAVAILFFFF